MKIALIGKGKTGEQVQRLAQEYNPTVFDSKNRPSVDALQGHDVIVIFSPGEAFLNDIPMLMASKIPVVSGATGFTWPEGINQKLKEKKLKWVYGSNFALGMPLIKEAIELLSKASRLYESIHYKIHEVHHTNKLDAPSGTALSWSKWLGQKVQITSERAGDVVGDHTLTLETPYERITLEHSSLKRQVFAQGALWACKKIIEDQSLDYGLHFFDQLVQKELLK